MDEGISDYLQKSGLLGVGQLTDSNWVAHDILRWPALLPAT